MRAPGGQVEGHQERPARHHHQEDDPTDGVIGQLSIALLEEVPFNGRSPIQLKKDQMYLEFSLENYHLEDVLHGIWFSAEVGKVKFVSAEAEESPAPKEDEHDGGSDHDAGQNPN